MDRPQESWIRKDTGLLRHHKTRAFAKSLGIHRLLAVGIITEVLSHVRLHCPDGDLSDLDPDDLAHDIFYEGDGDALLDALVEAGFIDRDGDSLTVHNWDTYNGRNEVDRATSRASSKKNRAKGKSGDTGDNHVTNGDNHQMSRDGTRPDLTRPDKTDKTPRSAGAQEEVSTKLDAEPERKPEKPKTVQPDARSKPCTGYNGKYADDCLRNKGRNRDGMWAVACGRCSRKFEPPADLPKPKETVAPAVKQLLAGAGDAIRDKTQAAVSPGSMRELLGKVSEPLPEPNDPTADQEAAENERRATTQALIDARRNGATNEPL